MRILLTGAEGQLGRRFTELAMGHEVIGARHDRSAETTGSLALRLEDPASCAEAIASSRPDWVMHAAAMTNVDACEKDPKAAWAANAEGTANLAAAAQRAGARMLYVSTDYVFDGSRGNYREADAVGPINAYGESKLGGERMGRAAMPDLVIARTSVVYGPHKKNFVSWLVDELLSKRPVRIVHDQHVTPTLTYDLAMQIISLIEADAKGTYHTAGATPLSRLAMAHDIASAFSLDASLIEAIPSSALTWTAKRPMDSTLATSKVSKYKRPLDFSAAIERYRAESSAWKAGEPLPR